MKRNRTKLICLLLVLATVVLSLVSCGSVSSSDKEGSGTVSSGGNREDGTTGGDDGEIDRNAEVYEEYKNLERIGRFCNGLAPFVIYESDGGYHWGSAGSWTGDYYFGYINKDGDVVIDPVYECAPTHVLPAFASEFVRIFDFDKNDCLIDKNGKVELKTGENGVTRIGNVSHGYFWVETEEEDLSGSMFTIRYYRARDMRVVATFNNARAFNETYYTNGESTLNAAGDAQVIMGNDLSYYTDELISFNISEYDSEFSAETVDEWTVNIGEVENFGSAALHYWHASGADNDLGRIAAVAMKNSNGTWFYATVDSEGNVLMQPQKEITFPIGDKGSLAQYEFCKNLCPAKDEESGFWGYIDPRGDWMIQPQYSSASAFCGDGYATVNDKIVIDTKGDVLLSPAGWKNEVITSLSGTYKYMGSGDTDWYLTFGEDGSLRITEDWGTIGSTWKTGTYSVKGDTLTVSGVGYMLGNPSITKDGDYKIRKEGDALIIAEKEWALSDVKLPEDD